MQKCFNRRSPEFALRLRLGVSGDIVLDIFDSVRMGRTTFASRPAAGTAARKYVTPKVATTRPPKRSGIATVPEERGSIRGSRMA